MNIQEFIKRRKLFDNDNEYKCETCKQNVCMNKDSGYIKVNDVWDDCVFYCDNCCIFNDDKPCVRVGIESKQILIDMTSFFVNKYNENFEISVPDEMLQYVSDKRDERFINLIKQISYINLDTVCDNIDSEYSTINSTNNKELFKWTLITDADQLCNWCIGLIMKCEYPYPIASINYDIEDDMSSIDLVYNSYTEYLEDLKSWTNKERNIDLEKKLNKQNVYSGVSDEDFAPAIYTFAQHIRYKRDLDINITILNAFYD